MQLHYAAANGNIEAVKRELNRGIPVDMPLGGYHNNSTTELILAAKRSSTGAALVKLLLEKGVTISAGDNKTALMLAAKSPFAGVAMLKLLLENGAAINVSGDETALSAAAHSGSIEKTQFLLKAGANPNIASQSGMTPLISAAYSRLDKNRKRLFKLLIKANAHLNQVTSYRESALSVSSYFGDFESVRVLLKAGAKPAPLQWTDLMYVIALGTVQDVFEALKKPQDMTAQDSSKRSVWQLCLMVGNVAKAKLLMKAGWELEELDILWAVRKDNPNMLRWLLSLGADPNTTDGDDTVLIQAAKYGATRCVNILLAAGANPHIENTIHSKAINFASNPAIAQSLMKVGADINHIDGTGTCVLKDAAERGNLPLVTALLALGANPNISSNGNGVTPLYVAVREDYYPIVKTLLAAGADPNAVTIDEWYPLQVVKTLETSQLLLETGANAAYKDSNGKYPADYHQDTSIKEFLTKAQF